jgi:hypothetical protein
MRLIELYNRRAVNQRSQFADFAEQLDLRTLCEDYRDLVQVAPKRHERGKSYFEGRIGVTRSGSKSNRREEHLAVSMYNASKLGHKFSLPDGRNIEILDYQTPLKAQRADRGVGKIDLFGILDGKLPCVIELKISPNNKNQARTSLADTPLRAILEGFAYCAIVEANGADIAEEAQLQFSTNRPSLLVMAPEDYWIDYLHHPKSGDWLPVLRHLTGQLAQAMKMEIQLLALMDAEFEMGLGGERARMKGDCQITSVDVLAARVDRFAE